MDKVLVPISAIEHWSYCPRQCGLIHLESIWDENVYTLRGTKIHERVDEPISRSERGARIERALPVWSDRHGLIGKCDVVEIHPGNIVMPVEYKSGRSSHAVHAELQLCAQALCLEEMLQTTIVSGAIFFAESKERFKVDLTATLRTNTLTAIDQIREMLSGPDLPKAVNDRRCARCSLIDACLPSPSTKLKTINSSLFSPRPETELP